MKKLIINSKIHNYEVLFEQGLEQILHCKDDEKSVFVIDKKVYQLYNSYFSELPQDRIYLIPADESIKNIESVIELYRYLLPFDHKRNLHLVSIGGGIIQDISGFVASTLFRGVNWTFFPTTLLAQADSCVGSKTSLNFDSYKNIIGTFYPPHKIVNCSLFLHTLSEDEINSGIGEIVKFLLLDDINDVCLNHIENLVLNLKNKNDFLPAIFESLAVKQSYIKQDEFDLGKRNLFNYGHCFGHALEATSNYKIPHGIAVILGMVFANTLSLSRGLISLTLYNAINNKLFFPFINIILCDSYFDKQSLLKALKNDKKRVGKDLSMIILTDDKFGAKKIDDLSESEFFCSLNRFLITMENK